MPAQKPRAIAMPGHRVFRPLIVAASSLRPSAAAREKNIFAGPWFSLRSAYFFDPPLANTEKRTSWRWTRPLIPVFQQSTNPVGGECRGWGRSYGPLGAL
jgi:hypothetical protein